MSYDEKDRNNRYTIKYGKYGAYFFDIDEQKDMPLDQVLDMLNYLGRADSMYKQKEVE